MSDREYKQVKIARAMTLAKQFGTRDDYEQALTFLRDYCADYPDDQLPLFDLGTVCSALGLRQSTYSAYKQLLNPPPKRTNSMRSEVVHMANFGEAAYLLGHLEEAAEAFAAVVSMGNFQAGEHLPNAFPPDNGEETTRAAAHVACGMRLCFTGFLGDLMLAVDHFKLALEILPSYEGARFYLAKTIARQELGRHEEALQLFGELQSSSDPVTPDYAKKEVQRISYWLEQQAQAQQ